MQINKISSQNFGMAKAGDFKPILENHINNLTPRKINMHALEGNAVRLKNGMEFIKNSFPTGTILMDNKKDDMFVRVINPDRTITDIPLEGFNAELFEDSKNFANNLLHLGIRMDSLYNKNKPCKECFLEQIKNTLTEL